MSALVSRKILALLLIVVFPSTVVMADRPSAMLTTSGTVRLNGTVMPPSTGVFTGDVVDTAADSVGSLSRNGSSVVVDPDSSIRYQDDGVSVLKGMARVKTSNGMAAHAGPISVIPVNNDALFEVRTDGKTALIASREGALTLTDGADSFVLDPGHTAKVSLNDVSQDTQAPKPAAKGGAKKRKLPPGWLLWVIAGGIGAAAIACALACGTSAAAVSPTVP